MFTTSHRLHRMAISYPLIFSSPSAAGMPISGNIIPPSSSAAIWRVSAALVARCSPNRWDFRARYLPSGRAMSHSFCFSDKPLGFGPKPTPALAGLRPGQRPGGPAVDRRCLSFLLTNANGIHRLAAAGVPCPTARFPFDYRGVTHGIRHHRSPRLQELRATPPRPRPRCP